MPKSSMAKSGATLTLYIKGERITAEAFSKAVGAFHEIAQEVTEEISGRENDVRWYLTAKQGSIELAYRGEPEKPSVPVARITEAVETGLRLLNTKPKKDAKAERPEFFSDTALQKAKEMSDLLRQDGIEVLQVWRSRRRFKVTQQTARNVESILAAMPVEVGTVEGKLEMLSLRGRLHFAVWEALHGKRVRCNLPDDPKLYEQAYAAFGKRVSVLGLVRSGETGDPTSVQVRRIDVFPDSSDVPTAEDVYGILSRGGKDE